jgi:hypothetical protein
MSTMAGSTVQMSWQPESIADSSFWDVPTTSVLTRAAMIIIMTALLSKCAVQIQKDYAAFVCRSLPEHRLIW